MIQLSEQRAPDPRERFLAGIKTVADLKKPENRSFFGFECHKDREFDSILVWSCSFSVNGLEGFLLLVSRLCILSDTSPEKMWEMSIPEFAKLIKTYDHDLRASW